MTCRHNRVKLLLALLTCLLSLMGCSSIRDRLTSKDSKMIKQESSEIIRCLTENDKESFCALFCERIRTKKTFNKEVDAAFDFFDCDTYIDAQIQEMAGGESSIEKGERTKWYLSPEITYIKVLQNKNNDYVDRYYGVHYYWGITDEEHKDLEGLHYLEITLLNTERSVSIGIDK